MLKYNMIENTINWVRQDYRENPMRFCLELFAWFMSIGCTIWMGYTLPNPPFIFLYPMFIFGCSLYAWTAYSRNSFGMLANYLLLVTIDIIGYVRLFY